jgi:hypothetical protein
VPGLRKLEQQLQDELKKKAHEMLESAKKRAVDASVAEMLGRPTPPPVTLA